METNQIEKKPVVVFSIADEINMPYFEKMKASLHHFHPEVPVELVSGELLKSTLAQDPQFFYRATPAIARDLIKEYKTVIKIDADSIVTGDISKLWTEEFDVAMPNNSNPKELEKYQVSVLNIHPLSYLNCGLVAMQSETFIDHWWKLCTSPHFNAYQFREQDLVNIMIFYGIYKAVFLDNGEAFWGLSSKGYWPQIEMKSFSYDPNMKTEVYPPNTQLILPKQEGWNKESKVIKVLHWAGGNIPNKMNFNTGFQPEVAEWLTNICKTKDAI